MPNILTWKYRCKHQTLALNLCSSPVYDTMSPPHDQNTWNAENTENHKTPRNNWGFEIPGANVEKIIPARDPKQCGGSGRIMYYNVVVVDDGDDVGDEYDDDDVQEDDVEDDDVEDDEVQGDDVEDDGV